MGEHFGRLFDPHLVVNADSNTQKVAEDDSDQQYRETSYSDTRPQAFDFPGGSNHLWGWRFPGGQGGGQRIAAGKRGCHTQYSCRTHRWLGLKATQYDSLYSGIKVTNETRRSCWRWSLGSRADNFGEGFCLKGAFAGEGFVEH